MIGDGDLDKMSDVLKFERKERPCGEEIPAGLREFIDGVIVPGDKTNSLFFCVRNNCERDVIHGGRSVPRLKWKLLNILCGPPLTVKRGKACRIA